jgi:RecB family endonuclease NucS
MEEKTRTLANPEATAARDAVREGTDAGAVVSAYGRCEVEYDGRASSYLGPGDRMVVLKPDGTLLVHTDEQRTPVNWQPPGCAHSAAVRDSGLLLTSERSTPEERVEVGFERVDAVVCYRTEDLRELELSGTEADLRKRILADPTLVEPGFEPSAEEYATGVGAADVLGRDAEGCRVVVELKRRRVGPTAAGQLQRYVEAVARESEEPVRGILVAPSVTEGARNLLEEAGLEFVSLAP